MWLDGRPYRLGDVAFAHAASVVGRTRAAAPSQRNKRRRSSE